MLRLPRTALFFALLLLLASARASAQYMYLDSNGDGVHTAADVLNAIGTTQVEIWLRTNHNRDGSQATCSSGESAETLTINSYTVALGATNGTITWTGAMNLHTIFGLSLGTFSSATEFYIGYAGATIQPPGDYRLARVSVAVASGSPSIAIIPRASTLPAADPFTSFGSYCAGLNFDNTLRLGFDWSDVDGLPYSAGGTTNRSPVLSAISDMALLVGETGTRDVSGTDADGDALDLSLTEGPAFVKATTLSSSAGALSGRILAHPRRSDDGDHIVTLSVTDGQNATQGSFHVEVSSGPNHTPVAGTTRRIDMVASTISRTLLAASDSDGDPIHFTKVDGPAYAQVSTAQSGHGGATGLLVLRPTLCDVGTSKVTVGLDDGHGSVTVDIPLQVLPPTSAGGTKIVTAAYPMIDLDLGDLDKDGNLDAVAVGEFRSRLQIFLGNGQGDLAPAGTLLPDLASLAVALGDWNGDGNLDIAVGGMDQQSLRILNGHGNGTFDPAAEIPGVLLSNQLVSSDLNGDGVEDLVSVGRFQSLFILLGRAGSGLALSSQVPMPGVTNNVIVADLDQDGAEDLVVTLVGNPGVLALMGRGDGTFGDAHPLRSTGGSLFALTSGDWNSDGRWDIAAGSFGDPGLTVGLGDGSGGMGTKGLATAALTSFRLGRTDWNGDGSSDILISDENDASLIAFGHGDGTFTLQPFGFLLSAGFKLGDLNEDGRPDVVATPGNWELRILLNPTTAPTGVVARAFAPSSKAIPIVRSSRLLDLHVEPVGGTFIAQDVDPSSLLLTSEGTGSVGSVAVALDKGITIGDSDHDGVAELTAPFRMSDLARLFDQLNGKTDVPVRLEGALLDGRRLCAPATLPIIGTGKESIAARIEPNPLNPRGVLRFTVEQHSEVTVRIFDATGRVARTVWDRRPCEPGLVEVPIDGRTEAGTAMASGVYFYQVEAAGSRSTGRFAILK